MVSLGYKAAVIAVDGLDYNLVIRWKPSSKCSITSVPTS